jgi:hypothetical protein
MNNSYKYTNLWKKTVRAHLFKVRDQWEDAPDDIFDSIWTDIRQLEDYIDRINLLFNSYNFHLSQNIDLANEFCIKIINMIKEVQTFITFVSLKL